MTTHAKLSWATAIGLLIAFAGPEVFVALSSRGAAELDIARQVVLQALYCCLPIAIGLIVVGVERLPLASIGLRRPDGMTLVTALIIFASGFVLQALLEPLIDLVGREGSDAGIAELAALPAWFRVVIALTGGVVEETLYRGYAIERLSALTGHRGLGATIATLVFAAAHIPVWGFGFALAADLPAGIVLTVFYLWRRDLIANMLAHSTGLLLAMFTVVPFR